MKKQIAIVVDDFGEHASINTAALELARSGRISAISCMTGGPAWLRGAAELRELDRHHVDLGLHLDLTQYPLGVPPWQHTRLVATAYLRRLDWRRLREQVERQCDAFESAVGQPPDHVDGHQHVHQLPQVRDMLVDTLYRRYDARPWLRDTRRARPTSASLSASLIRSEMKAAVIESLGARPLRSLAARCGFRQNRHLLRVHGLRADAVDFRELLDGWLRAAVTGDLLVAHPSTTLGVGGAMAANRAAEYAVLNSPEFPDMLREAQTEVVAMSRLLTITENEWESGPVQKGMRL